MAKKKPTSPSIPNPFEQVAKIEQESLKYKFGDESDKIAKVKKVVPRFAFDYISLEKKEFCFNSTHISPVKEYHKLLDGLKKLSDFTYDQLSTDKSFHFHEVNFSDITFKESDFAKCLIKDISKIDMDQLPTVYQFKVFEEARIFGFIAKSIFYLVFLDRNHNAYKRK
jgi:hypothetical protein